MLVLHVWRKWSSTIFLSPLHLFWMQGSAYIWSSESQQASHCIGTFVRYDLLQFVQRLHVLSRMPKYSRSALKKWGNVRVSFNFSYCVALLDGNNIPEVWTKVCLGGPGHLTILILICYWPIRNADIPAASRQLVSEVWWTWALRVSWIALFK